MAGRSSHGGEPIFTWTRAFIALIGVLVVLIGWLATRYITKVEENIPLAIKSEVSNQLPEAIKNTVPAAVKEQLTAQISEQIGKDISTQSESTRLELLKQQEEWQRQADKNIRDIFDLVTRNKKLLGNTLKNSVTGKEEALKSTIPLGIELLEQAKAKALAIRSKEDAPAISQADFDYVTNHIFRKTEDPDLYTKLKDMRIEVASFKTVTNGVEFGFPKPNRYSGREVFVGDDDFILRDFFQSPRTWG